MNSENEQDKLLSSSLFMSIATDPTTRMCQCRCAWFTFIAAHVGLILCIISLATNSWILGNTTPSNQTLSYSNTTCHKGLWESSCGEAAQIHKGNKTEVMLYYRIAQYFYGFSSINCTLGVFLMYAMLMFKNCAQSICCAGFLAAVLGVSALEGCVAEILIGSSFKGENTFPAEYKYLSLGWTFWVALASSVVIFFAMLGAANSACHKQTIVRQDTYERV